ncbi:hypothetical protein DXB65_09725 [Bacteroides oleiciplenus]|uniref:Uncharacterized protein n=1 Tax=Bacteroides oleiciplenus TaxID=626931 RepID=A0A3E5BEE4_9BACE|nr:hypothetical protein DXB65_09725 [Bacteroides oleiciplenus]
MYRKVKDKKSKKQRILRKNILYKTNPTKNYYICNQSNINSYSLMMKQLIAYCGLNCENSDARIATANFILPTIH